MNRGARRQRSAGLLSGVLAAVAATAPVLASGTAMEGTDFARVLPPAGAAIEPYANTGYSLEVEDGEVRIYVEVSPLESDTPFELPASGEAESQEVELARTVALGASSRYAAVSRILSWVSRNVRYELDRSQDQSPAAVLERRSAYCTGLAGLTVMLLEALDIPAREVSGYVVGETPTGLSGYHRWVEVYYPDRGWVFSDPVATHHYVPANYMRLSSDAIDLSRGHDGLLLERRDAVETADVYRAAPGHIRGRKNRNRQVAATLTVMMAGSETGRVTLEGNGLRRTQPFERSGSTFVGLAPGTYALELELDEGTTVRRRIELRATIRASLYLPRPRRHAHERPALDAGPLADRL